MPIIDFYNARPNELKPGDVLVCTVTLHVGHRTDEQGKPMYRMYRCDYPPQIAASGNGVPQGSNIHPPEAVMRALFPVIEFAGLRPDY